MIFLEQKSYLLNYLLKNPTIWKKKPSTTGIWTGTKLESGYQFKAISVRGGQYRIQNLGKDWK